MNKAEKERIDRMMKLGCAACASIGIVHIAQECHHILSGNIRMGHWYTLPLCRGHHQGDWNAEQREILTPKQLVAISDGRKAFTRVYPTERELWAAVQFVMRLDDTWSPTKLVPRSVA
jgi:hypothetical protein